MKQPDAKTSGPDRRSLGLFLAAATAVVPRLVFSRVNPVNYDGYWHIFIARNLPREFAALAHPPLFPILLRGTDAIRHFEVLVSLDLARGGYRGGLFFGLALQRLCRNRATPVLGTLALALSPSAILLSGVVESYMLCLAFLLAAFLAYLALIAPGSPNLAKARIAFSALGTLALLSHYAAGLFLVAALAAPLALAVLEPRYRDAWVFPRNRPPGWWPTPPRFFFPPPSRRRSSSFSLGPGCTA